MEALNLCIGHPTGIQQQYMLLATMQYHRHEQRINIPQEAAPRQSRGCTNSRKQTILVGGVYHRRYNPPLDTTTTNFLLKGRYNPPLDTTTTNFLLKGFAIDF